ncbi:MAG: hypothetical protein WA125_08890 [Desulfosporosinus sp.]
MKDNIKKYRWPLIVVILVLMSGYAGFYITTSTAFPQNPGTYSYFEKICNQPHIYHKEYVSVEDFWKYGGDCDERALAFKEYLESKGSTNIQTIRARNLQNGKFAQTPKGSYGHTFLLWEGKVYNPALNKTVRFYGTDLNEYKKLLKTDYYGVNTLYYENGTIESL